MCVWQMFEDKRGYRSWETSCDRSVDSEVSPVSSGYKFCPFCSEEIEFRPTKHAPDVVESEASSDIYRTSEVSASEAEPTPATTQVM